MADAVIDVALPRMRYDMTLPLFEGRVAVEGVRLTPAPPLSSIVTSAESPLRSGDFGLCDLNMGFLLPAIEAGWEIVALPVFSKRKAVHQFMFCRTDARIESPRDLEGKRIGTKSYRTAVRIWPRGLLQHFHGVDITRFHWIVGARDVFPLYETGAHLEQSDDYGKVSEADSLLKGDVDAIITDVADRHLFAALEDSAQLRRVFPDYRQEDERYLRATGIYTPMHIIVMSRRLDRAQPELAGKLFAAFEKAKALAYDDILSDRGGNGTMYVREAMREQLRSWGDIWSNGIAANRAAIDTFVRYNQEQGLSKSAPSDAEIFAASTLAT
jgi:4,5-dihydroxyphthalate decarboxylase